MSINDLTKEDLLAAVGLSLKRSMTERLLASVGFFATGLVVGAGVALLFAPKSGKGLREDISDKIGRAKDRVSSVEGRDGSDTPSGAPR